MDQRHKKKFYSLTTKRIVYQDKVKYFNLTNVHKVTGSRWEKKYYNNEEEVEKIFEIASYNHHVNSIELNGVK